MKATNVLQSRYLEIVKFPDSHLFFSLSLLPIQINWTRNKLFAYYLQVSVHAFQLHLAVVELRTHWNESK